MDGWKKKGGEGARPRTRTRTHAASPYARPNHIHTHTQPVTNLDSDIQGRIETASALKPGERRKLYERALRMCFEKRPDFGGTVITVGGDGLCAMGRGAHKKGVCGVWWRALRFYVAVIALCLRLRPAAAPCASSRVAGPGRRLWASDRVGSPASVEGRGPGLGRHRGKIPTCAANRHHGQEKKKGEGGGKGEGKRSAQWKEKSFLFENKFSVSCNQGESETASQVSSQRESTGEGREGVEDETGRAHLEAR